MTINNSSNLGIKSDYSWGWLNTILVGFLGYAFSVLITIPTVLAGFAIFGQDIAKNIAFNLILLVIADASFLAVVYLFLLAKKYSLSSLGLILPLKAKTILYLIPAGMGYLILTISLTALASFIFPSFDMNQVQNLPFKNSKNLIDLAISGVALIVVAPIAEELIFRGFIFKGLRKSFGFIGATFVSSLIFGIVHGQLNVALDTFSLGLFLCYLYEKTSSIWVSIALHSLKNGIAFYLIFFTNLSGL